MAAPLTLGLHRTATPAIVKRQPAPWPAWLRRLPNLVAYLLLVLGAVIFLMPIFWMISTSLKLVGGVFAIPIQWFPADPAMAELHGRLEAVPVSAVFLQRSIVVAIGSTVLSVLLYGASRATRWRSSSSLGSAGCFWRSWRRSCCRPRSSWCRRSW